ncbi:TOMM precursor leader peptide-binding protein [Streptomyces sp. HNM0663]|uniref:TOMM leader peptide-binding protein n=1 Tax=Streptomyces chengmaiensis TaxID=3040919 RepID=A0ABT6HTV4_9ACTN|nr:TOMM precursor leader peptide-binding protein [Streptomyces chengmaiensis]MDH2392158.1 TOMM precursor leader peptide-binding protein [Streptomyces chengmaiensis]
MPLTREPTHVLWTGTFGRSVADHLSRTAGWRSSPADVHGRRSAEWPPAAFRVVALWRHESALLARVARLHAAWGTAWLPVVQEYPVIRVGPLVVPGEGSCYSCYLRRRAQHDQGRPVTQALETAFDAAPENGVTGYTDAQALIAAGVTADLVSRHLTERTVAPGHVVFYNVLTRSLFADTVLGVHGCPECGPSVDPDDGWRELAEDLTRPPAAGAGAGAGARAGAGAGGGGGR